MDKATFATRYDAAISAPAMRRLYGESGYFNVGYWVDGQTDLVAACDRMVDEIAASVPRDAATIVDAGCGLGRGTRRVADRFPKALVIGANLSLWQLTDAQRRGVRAPVAMDVTEMAAGNGTADAVLAIESPQHFDTRTEFFAEARRVLRPGGVLSMADMLFTTGEAIGSWMLPPENRIESTAAYETLLRSAGFTDIVVRDVTELTWRPYCVAMRAVFEGREDVLHSIEESLSHYVLASARRA
jgi:MPBQ/MSBQ methyltransferase